MAMRSPKTGRSSWTNIGVPSSPQAGRGTGALPAATASDNVTAMSLKRVVKILLVYRLPAEDTAPGHVLLDELLMIRGDRRRGRCRRGVPTTWYTWTAGDRTSSHATGQGIKVAVSDGADLDHRHLVGRTRHGLVHCGERSKTPRTRRTASERMCKKEPSTTPRDGVATVLRSVAARCSATQQVVPMVVLRHRLGRSPRDAGRVDVVGVLWISAAALATTSRWPSVRWRKCTIIVVVRNDSRRLGWVELVSHHRQLPVLPAIADG